MSYVASRVYPKLKLLNRISSFLSPAIVLKICKVTIVPILDYGCTEWGFCSKKNSDFLERLQNKAMRIILRTNRLTCTQFIREKLGLLTLFNRRRYMRLQLVYCWFSHDVTKIQTKKLSILPRFYFHDALEQLKTNCQTNCRFKRVLGFVIEYA